MKIIRKRIIAFLIDSFGYAFVFVLFIEEFPQFFDFFGKAKFLFYVIPLFLKELTFRNASIGKKIMGLVIYDSDWNVPSFLKIVIRTIFMTWLGYSIYILLGFIKTKREKRMFFIELEFNLFKTRVVEKKVYKKLKAEAEQMDGDFKENMTTLYNKYLYLQF